MKRVAIIGGGITGLSAAFYLESARRNGVEIDYALFESSPRLGGVLKTDRIHDAIIEAGPDSFLSSKPWATQLAREVGLEDELINSNDYQRKTYILNRGRLTPLPDGIQMIVPTKAWPIASSLLLSFSTKLRMLREYIAPPEPLAEGADESVASFVKRHFGDEVVEKLASPLLAGVYGGDATQLSARAVLANLMALEAKHRSLVRGVLHSRANSSSSSSVSAPAPLFTSFKSGMQQFVDAIAGQLKRECIFLNQKISAIMQEAEQWRVISDGRGNESFTDLVIALPAHAAGKLLYTHRAELGRTLDSIKYSNTITIALGYSSQKLRGSDLPPGFGFLVPRSEGRSMIACTFVHNKFSYRVADDQVLLRVFLTDGLEKSDAELQAIIQRELAEILHINTAPNFASIGRWSQAMPQYEVGHLEKVAAIEQMAGGIPHLQLIGNAYRGIGIPDCVREGKQAAERILQS
jgi:oxygen-dependent protoporphyrinogen oxidase